MGALIDDIVQFLGRQGLIAFKDDHLLATRFGRRVSELYIDPLTGIILRDALFAEKAKQSLPLLHMLAHTPDMMVVRVRKRDYEAMLELFYRQSPSLLIPEKENYPTDDLLSELKTAAFLQEWIEESPPGVCLPRVQSQRRLGSFFRVSATYITS